MRSFLIGFLKALFSPRQSRRSYAQFGEDCIIDDFFGRKTKRGFFVDVGCHHPRKGSNTYLLYKRGWRGVLVDLEMSKIWACRILRPGDISILAAVSDKAEKVNIYAPREFSVLATIDQASATPESRPIGAITTQTLTAILDATKFTKQPIDLLSIDVEGVDLQVLKGLDFEVYRPKIIVIESWLTKMEDILASEKHLFLKSKGYELFNWVGLSTIYRWHQT